VLLLGGKKLKREIVKLIFGALPEVLLLVYVGPGLLGIKTSIKNYLKITTFCMLSLIVTRNILYLTGVHSFIICFVLILSIKFIIKVNWKSAIISSLFSFVILFLGDILGYWVLKDFFGIYINEFIASGDLMTFLTVSYLMKLPLLLGVFLIAFFDYSFINLFGENNARF
jgi:hypothetical protein